MTSILTDDEAFDALLRAVAETPEAEPEAPDRTGTLLAGRYRLEARIGAGGMGVVYRATDEQLGRQVAVKLVRAEGDPRRRALLLREARAAAAIQHPRVAAIFDLGLEGEEPFIAMAFVEGLSLAERLEQEGPLGPAALPVMRAVAEGLAAAHTAGVIHRDLKPANLQQSTRGEVFILDFGLARPPGEVAAALPDEVASSELTVGAAGTRRYMSPEQAQGLPVDARTDVYAFGVTLVELWTGQIPAVGEPLPPMPRAVQQVVHRCLALEPAARWPDGSALMAALASLERPGPWLSGWPPLGLALSGALAAWMLWPSAERDRLPLEAPPEPPNATAAPDPTRATALTTWRPLTAQAETVSIREMAVSPAGDRVVYVEPRGVFLASTSGQGAPQRLDTEALGRPACARWINDEQLLVTSLNQGQVQLWRLSAQGAAPGLLLDDLPAACAVPDPEGRRVALMTADGVSVWSIQPDGARQTWPMPGAAIASAPVWAPDGQALAVMSSARTLARYQLDLQVLTLADGRWQVVMSDPTLLSNGGMGSLHWGADGLMVARATRKGLETALWRLPYDAREGWSPPERLVALPGRGAVLRLDRGRGASEAALLVADSRTDVYVMDLPEAGGPAGPPRRITLSNRNQYVSDWAADGEHLLIVSDTDGQFTARRQPLDGSPEAPMAPALTRPPQRASWPRRSPSGLLYWTLSERGAGTSLALHHLPTSGALAGEGGRRLFETSLDEAIGAGQRPAPRIWWAQCTARCVISRRDGPALEMATLDPNTGERAVTGRIPHVGGNYGWGLSPEGDRVALADGGEIKIHRLDGTLERTLSLGPGCTMGQFVGWMPGPQPRLVATGMCQQGAEPYHVWLIEADGAPRSIFSSSFEWPSHLAISPDGRRLAVTLTRFAADVWWAAWPASGASE